MVDKVNVDLENMNDFLDLENVLCVGGSWLATKELIKEKKFEPVPDYTVCDICVGQDECYLEESKKTFDSWTKEDYLRAVKVADYIKEAKLDAMIDIFEHPENFIVEGIGTIADILSSFSILRFGIYFVTNPTLPL